MGCRQHGHAWPAAPVNPAAPFLAHLPPTRQDELFNLTTDEIKSSAVRTRLEVKVRARAL